jgi:lipoprotein-releasing system ATP-binding protein
VLQVDRLSKRYDSPDGPLTVLDDVSFTVDAGGSLAVMGPSGSGKSTLLNVIGTIDTPSSGTVTLDGIDPFTLSERDLAHFRNGRIGFVFQDHALLPQCTVLENVLTPTLVAPHGNYVPYARELLDRVRLSHRLQHRPGELSGGEKQRVALARALVMRPRIVLCDEPTGNLDHRSADLVATLLLELHAAQQNILIVVTHSAELARRFARRFELTDGRLASLELSENSRRDQPLERGR